MRHYFILVVLLLGFIQCKKSENPSNIASSAQNSIQHAEGFSIEKYDGFSVVKVSNAYPEAKDNYTYVLHKKGVQIPDSLQHFTAIEVPIKKSNRYFNNAHSCFGIFRSRKYFNWFSYNRIYLI